MAEWTPVQLDRLEDALDDLEHDGALERWLEDDPGPGVRERLEDYRALLVASREALPLEEVPEGVLDGVLEEARRAAAAPAMAMTSTVSWWTRLRRSVLVPAVALAGTAMLVLWIGRPDEVTTTADEAVAIPAPPPVPAKADGVADDEAPPATAKPAEPSPIQQAAPGGGLGSARGSGAPAEPASAPEPEPELELDAKDIATEKAADVDEGSMQTYGEAPTEEQKQTAGAGGSSSSGAKADPASGRWDLISLGDRARQAGDCIAARDEYALALEDDDPRVRARAFAGIGLCDAMAGDEPSADANFERGRELDGGIDGFIDSQRESNAPRKKTKRRSSKKKPAPKQNAMDPFN